MSGIRTAISGDETPQAECTYCGHPFPNAERLALHKGVEHGEQLDAGEREAFETAYDREKEALRSIQLRSLAVLVFVYFGFLFLYAFFT